MNYTEPKVIYTCFPGGKHKVLTMSYDDGRLEDRRLVALFNRYGIRGTFNLNGGLPRPERIPESEWVELYKGHEVACHTYHHPTISRSPLDQTARQVLADRMQLEGVMGYPVRGLAYPNGSWTPEIAALLPALGIRYARVVGDTHDFAMPHDFMTWKATCHHTHNLLEDGKRVDGRGINEIRPLAAEVGILPRVHGSGMFTRGQTQVLTTCTLGGTKDNQLMDDLTDEQTKRYIHHYNFPPYSVGEARAPRSPGRREIGHGALAERALVPVLPSLEEFPYTIRCVSEVLSSNGSTSQASICGSTLALMDAGVPIKAPVAGISCGLITEGDRWMTMLDIQGVEDFHGDMDFKVGGTRKGITAIQMDIKIDGLTYDIIAEAFEKCRKGRLYILDEIIKPVIAEPRQELSRWAPKMFSMMIPTDKIKDVIGKGGKVIQDICATCNCKIDVQEDGHVFVSAVDQEDAKRAIFTIKTIVEDPEIGAIYKGKVTRLMNFGAFVEIAPGKEGLVHISKLDTKRVERVEDVVAVGDAIVVKVTDIDQQGRINLSRRDAILALEAKRAAQQQ